MTSFPYVSFSKILHDATYDDFGRILDGSKIVAGIAIEVDPDFFSHGASMPLVNASIVLYGPTKFTVNASNPKFSDKSQTEYRSEFTSKKDLALRLDPFYFQLFTSSLEILKSSPAPDIQSMMKLFAAKYGNQIPIFRVTGSFQEQDATPFPAGFHRATGSICLYFAKINPDDWMIKFSKGLRVTPNLEKQRDLQSLHFNIRIFLNCRQPIKRLWKPGLLLEWIVDCLPSIAHGALLFKFMKKD